MTSLRCNPGPRAVTVTPAAARPCDRRTWRAIALAMTLTACGKEDVVEPPRCSVTGTAVTGAPASMTVGQAVTLAAQATSNGCAPAELTPTWRSSSAAVAAVSAAGVVTAVSPGTATITASIRGAEGSAGVTVVAPCVVTALVMAGLPGTMSVSQSAQLTTSATQTGCTPGDLATTWTSSAPTVASVTATGRVTALSEGNSTITATVRGVSATQPLTVTPFRAAVSWTAEAIAYRGQVERPTSIVYAMSAPGASALHTVDAAGSAYRWSGSTWMREGSIGTATNDVHVLASGEGIAVGGTAYRRRADGTWAAAPTGVNESLNGVWMASPTNAFAVGSNGRIVRYDGASWNVMASGTTTSLNDVWGAGPNQVYAVGANGTVLRFNGTVWGNEPTGIGTDAVAAVGGNGAASVCIATTRGRVYYYDGTSWRFVGSMPLTTNDNVERIEGARDGASCLIVNFFGGLYRASTSGVSAVATTLGSLQSVAVDPTGKVYVGGFNGTVLEVQGGSSTAISFSPPMNAVVALTPTNALAFGEDGAVATYGPQGWSLARELFTKSDLLAAWAGSPTDVVVAEWTGGKIWRSSGANWVSLNAPNQVWVDVSGAGQAIFAVGATQIFGLGSQVFSRYDGTTWRTDIGRSGSQLNGVWAASPTEAFAVGPSGGAWRFDGSSWQTMSTGVSTSEGLFAVWGTSASNVIAVGSSGIIVRYDGTRWQPMASGVTASLYGIWGSSDRDVYAVGTGGVVLHYDGRTWTQQQGTGSASLFGVNGLASGGVIAIGGAPSAVRGQGPGGTFGLVASPAATFGKQVRPATADGPRVGRPSVMDARAMARYLGRPDREGLPAHLMR